MALSTGVNWISNFIIAFITPPLFATLKGGYYFLLMGFAAISGVFVFFVYPETAGKTLEELGTVFGDKTRVVEVDAQEKGVGEEIQTSVAVPQNLAVEDALLPSSEVTLLGSDDISESSRRIA